MSPSARHASTPPNGGSRFTTSLRFELVDEEQRALLGSYAIASALGLAFLLLVQFGPRITLVPVERAHFGPIVIGELNPFPEPSVIAATNRRQISAVASAGRMAASIANAFSRGGTPTVGQPTNILGNVALTPSGGSAAGGSGKTVLAHGEGGMGSIPPGRGGIPGTSGGSDIGGVTGARGVTHAAQQVVNPAAIPVEPLPPLGNTATLGTYVRGHESQLRFCYEETGLAVNPRLAGSITVAITVAGNGSVSKAAVTKRTWSGPGAAESEACILRAIQGWRLPASERAQSTYSFPFNFSK